MREVAPRVSVVMAVYDGERHLQEAVQSILAQTYRDFEFLVVDDGSTDGTGGLLASYDDPRLRVVRQANAGLTRALNRALALARGEYIARQDADDWSHPDRLARQVRFLDAHPAVALVGTWVRTVDEEGEALASLHFETDPVRIAALLPTENHFTHGAIMVRRAALEAVGGYRDAFRYAQDYDLTLRLSERFVLANIPEELYTLRHGRSKLSFRERTLQASYAKLARRLAEERRRHGVDSLTRGCPVEELLPVPDEQDELEYHRQMAYFFLRAGNPRKARRELRVLLRTDGVRLRTCLYLAASFGSPWLGPRLLRLWERVRGGSRVFQ